MSKRHRNNTNHRFALSEDADSGVIMDTSIGSDGERSDNDYDYVTPSVTPLSVSGTKRTNGEFLLNLKFSIENILKPEFGCQNNRDGTGHSRMGGGSETSQSPTNTPSPVTSPHYYVGAGQQNAPIGTSNASTTPSPTPGGTSEKKAQSLWPAWVYCTRYSDRPSSGPRCRRVKREKPKQEEKRPRTAFTTEQLSRLKAEFQENRYLTEKRRQDLARDLGLNESQIKIWFQNKRAKIKKQSGGRNVLALHLMAQGLYNHATIPVITDGMSPNHDENGDIENEDTELQNM